jgi:hypothetical protein
VVGTAAAGVSTPGYAIILSLPALPAAPSNYIMRTHGSACRKRARDDAINYLERPKWMKALISEKQPVEAVVLFCMKHLGEFSASCFSSIKSTHCKKG